MSWLRGRFFPELVSEERERRLRLFRLFLIVQIVATIILAALAIVDTQDSPHLTLITVVLCLAVSLLSLVGYLLARRGALHMGGILLVVSLLVSLGYFSVVYGSRGPIPFLFVWPIMVAAILLEPPMALIATSLAALIYGGISLCELYQVWPLPLSRPEFFDLWHRPDNYAVYQRFVFDLIDVVVVYYATAFLAWVASHSLRQAAARSQEQAAELGRYRIELEERVAERTAELNQALETLQTSLQVIQEMGSPVLPVAEGVLLAPLIGALDSERVRLVMGQLLRGIAEHRARMVIIDITGVPMVDTAVANALIQTAQGARLLGATPVLVGIRAEVAQTVVDLGVDLQGVVTRASLQEGLAYALGAMASTGR